jgi:3-oxoacyl-[acyl-carrier protein] reductase
MMELGLAGRVAVVTAASRGIGRATALALADQGVTVACCARSEADLASLAAAGSDTKGSIHTWIADLEQPAEVDRFIGEARRQLGAVDILINNVGASPSRNFLYMSAEDWAQGLQLNLLAAVRSTQLVLPDMRKRKWGRVVMVSSGAAKTPSPALIDYAAAKAALVSVAGALARKYGPDGVLVNSVLPGLIRTDMWERTAAELATPSGGDVEAVFAERSQRVPVGRFGTAQEVADTILFIVSERASYLNGAALDVDGGMGSHLF